jgi:hypothetical protein
MVAQPTETQPGRFLGTFATAWGTAVCCILAVQTATAQIDFEREPIQYSTAPHHDPVALLQERIDRGQAKLEFDARRGFLVAVLRELSITEKSQVLVFSKTSFQRSLISPKRPRALYFNDDTYIGWVQYGEVIEVSSVAPHVGPVFYALDQKPGTRPAFARQTDECLQCHASSMTDGLPGHLVRSVFPGISGSPVLSAGSYRTTFQSPLAERWGGWYVTGTHGDQRHMGNTLLRGTQTRDEFDRESGANLTDLRPLLDVGPYLTPHSDLVALMVLEHQVPAHNLFTLTGYRAVLAVEEQRALNAISGKPPEAPVEGIQRRIGYLAEDLLKCLLMSGETTLTSPIRGTSGFAEYFASLGPRDKQGRSLREFDLTCRLFKYPCSYLVYSQSFAGLPAPVRDRFYRRLWEVLTGHDQSPAFAHLSQVDRRAIHEILSDTKSDLPEYWNSGKPWEQ